MIGWCLCLCLSVCVCLCLSVSVTNRISHSTRDASPPFQCPLFPPDHIQYSKRMDSTESCHSSSSSSSTLIGGLYLVVVIAIIVIIAIIAVIRILMWQVASLGSRMSAWEHELATRVSVLERDLVRVASIRKAEISRITALRARVSALEQQIARVNQSRGWLPVIEGGLNLALDLIDRRYARL